MDISQFFDALLGLSASEAKELGALQVCARAVVIYVLMIAYVRIGKKRFLSQLTAFDAVLVIMIGAVASRAISGTAPFFPSMAGTLALILFHWIISYLSESSDSFSTLVKGHDTVLVKNGRIIGAALKKSHMSRDDLAQDLRDRGVDDIRQVKEARLERSGRVSVIRKK
ncbi:MAG: DUF421 domain-containing protein [Pseudolabrys sp.]|nr:DUF421 domain-containing protein [Pseudolabrys sp.]